jgi:hypothetical protein
MTVDRNYGESNPSRSVAFVNSQSRPNASQVCANTSVNLVHQHRGDLLSFSDLVTKLDMNLQHGAVLARFDVNCSLVGFDRCHHLVFKYVLANFNGQQFKLPNHMLRT